MSNLKPAPVTQYPVPRRRVRSTNDVLVAYYFGLFYMIFLWICLCFGVKFHPILQTFILFVTFALVERRIFSRKHKSSLTLTGKGVEIGDGDATKLMPWDWLTKVEIHQKTFSLFPNYVCLKFKDNSDSLLLWDDIRNAMDSTTLISCVRTWAPHAEIVGDENLTKSESIATYTELWLKDLSSAKTPRRLNAGQTLAQGTVLNFIYKIQRVLGGGGQGTVYTASVEPTADVPGLPPKVVIKEYILPANERGMKKAKDSLMKEVTTLQRISHPNIIRLYDYFVEDARAYFALEFVEGTNLRHIVEANGPLPEKEVKYIGMKLCDILTYLHELTPPVVHGDATPDNIMMSFDGSLKLMDFDASVELTRNKTNTVVGKHAYMSPEQFKGEISETSDQYALGGLLNFLLTGADPEPMTESAPANLNSLVSEEMSNIIAKSTKLDVHQRYSNLREMGHALEQL